MMLALKKCYYYFSFFKDIYHIFFYNIKFCEAF